MRIQSVQQNTYKRNSNPNFKMILNSEITNCCNTIREEEQLAELIARIGPKCQKVGFRVLVSKDPQSPISDVEIVSGNLKVIGQVPFNYKMKDIKDLLKFEYGRWAKDPNNILRSLGFDKYHLVNPNPKSPS